MKPPSEFLLMTKAYWELDLLCRWRIKVWFKVTSVCKGNASSFKSDWLWNWNFVKPQAICSMLYPQKWQTMLKSFEHALPSPLPLTHYQITSRIFLKVCWRINIDWLMMFIYRCSLSINEQMHIHTNTQKFTLPPVSTM